MLFVHKRTSRRGAVLPLVALSIIALMTMMALAIDIGLIAIARNHCQNAADAGAMAGCRRLNGNETQGYNFQSAPNKAIEAATSNTILNRAIAGDSTQEFDIEDESSNPIHQFTSGSVDVQIGTYTYVYNDADPSSEKFELYIPRNSEEEPYSAVRVTIQHRSDYQFAKIFGLNFFDVRSTAVAVHRPRDIVIVMDLSGSMRFQSMQARSVTNARTVSLNPDPDVPEFGHYSSPDDQLIGTSASGQLGLSNLTYPPNLADADSANDSMVDKVIADYFFDIGDGDSPDPATNRAFVRADAALATAPGGLHPLKTNKNSGDDYAKTLADVIGASAQDILDWHRYGYDWAELDNDSWDPPTDNGYGYYTTGPGYWGKTFFQWPPDPRGATLADASVAANQTNNGAKDWRQRFFVKLKINPDPFVTESERITGKGWVDHNNILYQSPEYVEYAGDENNSSDVGQLQSPYNTSAFTQQVLQEGGPSVRHSYYPNYNAILAWLRSDPNPFPSQLRAGRIRYYDEIPDPSTDSGINERWWTTNTNSLTDLNERFWKGYIDFVLGYAYTSPHYRAYRFSPSAETLMGDFIGNGRPFQWGTVQVKQKPVPKLPYMTGTVDEALSADSTDWIQIDGLNGTLEQPTANTHFVTIGTGATKQIYLVTEVDSYDEMNATVKIKVDAGLFAEVSDDTEIKFYTEYPEPYMDYSDNPMRPKHQWWFGPQTFIDYIGNYNIGPTWWPGNIPEQPSSSCKIGIQSAIDDIKTNRPNDFVSMTFFSNCKTGRNTDGQHQLAVVPLGRQYDKLKEALWFPPSTVLGAETEIHPWHPDMTQVPRANGLTAPQMAFMIAYNQLSSSETNLRDYSEPIPPEDGSEIPAEVYAQYRGRAGGLGRRGAERVVIFETDGVPNTRRHATITGTGEDSYYPIRVKHPDDLADESNTEFPTGGGYANDEVYTVVKQIVALDTASPPGFSTRRKPAKVFAIGFGELFRPGSPAVDQTNVLTFLQTIQFYGNTATTTTAADFPPERRVYGDTDQRAARLQAAFSSILQSGVQVSLIE
ncbi:MAG: pilus assembly protein TadG-related protein [Gemmataceae bacterium]